METEQELSPQEYEHLLAQYEDSFKNLQEGQIIRGRVIGITPSEVIVDIGYKSEGIIPVSEFTDFAGKLTVKEGDAVDVLLERTEDQNGYVVLSKDKAEKMKVWDEVEKSYRSGTTVRGRVIDRIKGGLAVDIGVKAFLPGSLVDVKPVKNLESLRGRDFDFKVISVDKKRGNIVLSRKAVVEVEQEAKKKETLQLLEEGRVLRGTVKNLTDYGAFVDLGGLDGLLHVTDMSWGRVNHPSDLVKVGDEIDVVVLKFDRETERVSLGTKQLTEDPWSHVPEKYPAGSRVTGRVTNVTDYGAFVELEEGVEGLVHVSEMSWSKKVKNPSKVVSPGDTVEAVVSDVNRDARRISLSLEGHAPGSLGQRRSRSTPSAAASRARCAISPTSARSSSSRRASTASCTSPTCRGPSGQAPVRGAQEGRRRRGDHHVDRPGEPADLALDQGIPAERLADLPQPASAGRHRGRRRLARGGLRRLRADRRPRRGAPARLRDPGPARRKAGRPLPRGRHDQGPDPPHRGRRDEGRSVRPESRGRRRGRDSGGSARQAEAAPAAGGARGRGGAEAERPPARPRRLRPRRSAPARRRTILPRKRREYRDGPERTGFQRGPI